MVSQDDSNKNRSPQKHVKPKAQPKEQERVIKRSSVNRSLPGVNQEEKGTKRRSPKEEERSCLKMSMTLAHLEKDGPGNRSRKLIQEQEEEVSNSELKEEAV